MQGRYRDQLDSNLNKNKTKQGKLKEGAKKMSRGKRECELCKRTGCGAMICVVGVGMTIGYKTLFLQGNSGEVVNAGSSTIA